jgi:hypothetical protein
MPEIEQSTERTSPRDDVLFGGGRQSSGRPYDDVMFGGPPSTPGYDPPRRQYRRLYPHLSPGRDQIFYPTKGDQLRREIKRWRSTGDDSNLVPHGTYPGQTSNPVRPRTQAIGYDEEARELRIKFREGSIYVYYDVPPDVYEELLSVDSIGHYMNDHLVHSYMYDQESYNRPGSFRRR